MLVALCSSLQLRAVWDWRVGGEGYSDDWSTCYRDSVGDPALSRPWQVASFLVVFYTSVLLAGKSPSPGKSFDLTWPVKNFIREIEIRGERVESRSYANGGK